MREDLSTLSRLPQTRFRVYCADPAFKVTWQGGNRFRLSGEVALQPSADLGLSTPDDEVEVVIAARSTPQQAAQVLRRALPRDISMSERAVAGDLDLTFQEALLPAARVPHFRVWTTDASLRLTQLDDNTIEFNGRTMHECLLTLLCDSRRSMVTVPQGTSAASAAARVAANVPQGFRAVVDGPVVSIWKDADFFAAVA